jgi:hypothetical protein
MQNVLFAVAIHILDWDNGGVFVDSIGKAANEEEQKSNTDGLDELHSCFVRIIC